MPDPDTSASVEAMPTDVALCIDPDAYRRLRPVLKHLCVAMIDYNVTMLVLSSSAEVAGMTFGPIRMMTYERPLWPTDHLRLARQLRFREVMDQLVDHPPDVAHAVSAGAFEAAHWLAGKFDLDLVLQLTTFDDVDALWPALVERTTAFIVSSQPILERLEELVAPSHAEVSLIRPGLLAGTEPTCFSKPGGTPAVLCSEGFRPGTGVDHLLKAARLLLDRKREFLMFLTGTGPMESDLRRQAMALRLASTVIFARPTGDLERVVTGADIYVEPNVDPTLSAGPIHAMANGMAVIAVEGGAADCFVDGVTAMVCPDNRAERLADAIERILDDRAFAARLAAGAINHIRQFHTISNMAEQTVERYRSLLARRRTYSIGT
jgi:glycosyltransferase involved in cell wall biosynthesis